MYKLMIEPLVLSHGIAGRRSRSKISVARHYCVRRISLGLFLIDFLRIQRINIHLPPSVTFGSEFKRSSGVET
jgi:hypothetical protein